MQVESWRKNYPDSNILLRMAPDIIGIDVDMYDDKRGAHTITEIAAKHGELPTTAVSTARTLPSGIYWYRLSQWMDTDKMRDPGEHVEVIRYGHRYAVVPPSWHQGARASYRWVGGVVPTKESLPTLPTEWYVHLNRGCSCFEQERAERRRMTRRVMNRPTGEAGRVAAHNDLMSATHAIRIAGTGSRNNILSSIAGRFFLHDVIGNGVLDSGEVWDALRFASLDAGLNEQETTRTLRSAFDWATREGDEK